MSFGVLWRSCVFLVVGVLAVVGCSGDPDVSSSNALVSSSADSGDGGVGGGGSQGVVPASQSLVDSSEFTDLWDAYLVAYDRVMAGDDPDLGAVAVSGVVDSLNQLGQVNQERLADGEFDAVVEVASSANLESDASASRPRLTDCTTQTIQVPDEEPFRVWVSHDVAFTETEDGWRISSVDVVQDGWTVDGGESEHGCLPFDYRAEAERVADLFMVGSKELEADPAGDLPDALLESFGEQGRGTLERHQGYMIDAGIYSESPVDVYLDVLGLDFSWSLAEGPVATVAACVVYPEGQVLRSVETGEVVEESLAPAQAQHVWISVVVGDRNDSGLVGRAFSSEPAPTGCD